MSETVPTDAPAEVAAEEPIVQATETPAEQPTEVTEEPAEQAPPKPSPRDRRVAQLSARLGETTKAFEEMQRRADAAEALLRAAKGEPDPAPNTPNEAEIRQRIAAENRAESFNTQRTALIAKGEQEFGRDVWLEHTTILGEMGAATNQTFLEALVELSNAPKIVAALANDPDTLADMLRKSPTGMAAQLGRMDAQMERAATPPAPKTVSTAPRPPNPIQTGAVVKEPDPFNPDEEHKMSMKEWNAAFEKSDVGKRLLRRRA